MELTDRIRENLKKKSLGALKKWFWENVYAPYIRKRDQKKYGRCRICGVNPIECAYHLIPQNEGNACRFDDDAVVGACHNCNGLEYRFRRRYWLIHERIFGKEFMARLDAKSRTTVQYKRYEIIEMIEKYAEKMAAL